jgi:hypothetical protein
MINFPPSTKVNRFIPKEKFYSKTIISSKLRELFTNEVEKIIWAYKISPTTLNITSGAYSEMQAFEISLKRTDLNTQVLKHIDTYIPYPILFILKRRGETKLVISHKEPSLSNNSVMKVNAYFDTNWQVIVNIELKGRSVDEIYKNYIHQIAPSLDLKSKIDVKSAIEYKQSREKIVKQIDALNRAILNEPSVAKKQELARQRYSFEQQL